MNKRASVLGVAASLTVLPFFQPPLGGPRQDTGDDQTIGTSEFTVIDQQGQDADAIRNILAGISLPPGFEITLYALAPGARHMAVGPKGVVTFVGTLATDVWAVADHDQNRVAEVVKNFAPSTAKSMPNGPCFSPGGVLYIAEQNRVLAYPGAESAYDRAAPDALAIIPDGELIPEQFVSAGHSARVCDFGPDNKLYISLGQPYNVPPKQYLETFSKLGIGGIIRLNEDGTGREVYTRGIRNSVGHDFNPNTGELWFTDNQVDGMGDDIPPGEINRQTTMGQHFGFPWYGGGEVRTNEYKDEEIPFEVVFPVSETVAHAADLGMVFYQGNMFPEKYRGGIFSAQHGSWSRTIPIGARVMFTPVDAEGNIAGETVPFAEGWMEENGNYVGRPVDVAELPDGSLLVSDDRAGALYRIAYTGSGS